MNARQYKKYLKKKCKQKQFAYVGKQLSNAMRKVIKSFLNLSKLLNEVVESSQMKHP